MSEDYQARILGLPKRAYLHDRRDLRRVIIPLLVAAGFYTLFSIFLSSVNSFVVSTSPVLWGLLVLLLAGVGISWRWFLPGSLLLFALNVLPYVVLNTGLVTIYDPIGVPTSLLVIACLFLFNVPLLTSALALFVKGRK